MNGMPKIALVHPMGLHEYTRVPMGLFIAPPKFMRYIDVITIEASLNTTSKGFLNDLLSEGSIIVPYVEK